MAAPKTGKAARKPYRRGVGIALIDARGRVFVGQRIDTPKCGLADAARRHR